MDFEEFSLAELAKEVVDNRGRTCPVGETGLPLIATNCIRNDLLYPAYETTRFVSDETYNTWFRGHPQPGDLIFVTKGSPGRVCWAPDPVDFCIAQDMVALRPDSDKVYPKYLFALLRSPEVQRRIANMHVGTLIPHFKKGDFDKLLLPVPPRKHQELVGDLYFALSERVDLLQKSNRLIESMAQAIFKSWFIDFDPVRAKAEGREPEGVDAETAALFPIEFEDSELGPIPKGWHIVRVGDVMELAYGKALKESDRTPGPVVVMGSNGPIGSHSERLVEGPGIVVGRKGNPGTVSWIDEDFFPIDTTFYVIPKGTSPLSYLYFALQGCYLPNLAADSAVPGLNRNFAYACTIIIPSVELERAFGDLYTTLRSKVQAHAALIATLTQIRDHLLPRLISGKLRIPEAQEIVEEVLT